jgi:hypothetical protein
VEGSCNTYKDVRYKYKTFVKGKGTLTDLKICEKSGLALKSIVKKQVVRIEIGFSWLGVGCSSRLL